MNGMQCYRFGPFELDTGRGELRKHGLRIRIQNQPLQVLRTLVERADQVVDREALRQAVWANDTFVDFEHGLNAAMNKLRRSLGDSAESPRYIETLAGRGYRFIGPLKNDQPGPSIAVEAVSTLKASPPETLPPLPRKPIVSSSKAWLSLAALATAFGIWGLITLLTTRHSEIGRPVFQFTIAPPPGTIFAPPISRQPFAISPDGTRLAFTATGPNGTNVWVRDLASLDMRPVPGTEGAWVVFWLPDSRSILYSVKRTLKQANLETGSTRSVVANLPFLASFGAWRSKKDLLLYLAPQVVYELLVENGALWKVPGVDLRHPQFLPHSDRVLHVAVDPASGGWRAQVTDYVSRKATPLMETDSRVQYAPPLRRGEPGKLLYIRGGSLLVQPFDADRLKIAGEPIPILQNVIYFGPSAQACFSVSDSGVLVYQAGWPLSELKWYDRAGRAVGTVGSPAPYVGTLRISPDGRQVAAAVWNPDNGRPDIWVFDANGRESRRLTYPPASHLRSVWSPDGERVAFAASRTGPPRLMSVERSADGKEQEILNRQSIAQATLNQIQVPTDWSRDGRFIAFDNGLGEEEQESWLAETGSGKITPLSHGEFAQWGSVFSPDGTRVAFVSMESGQPEVYVQAFAAMPTPRLVGERRQISRDGAWIVRWRPDGRELFYVGIDNWLRAVPAAAGLQFGESKSLFRIEGTTPYGTTSDFQFDVATDGQRFLMSTAGSVAPPPFTVIQNWQEKLHR